MEKWCHIPASRSPLESLDSPVPWQAEDAATILVVDDRAPDRELLVYLLRHSRYRVLEAADGAEALRLAKAEHPDLVISDVLLPEMDGYEFVRQLREDPSIAGTTVIFYTAVFNEQEARNLARDLGVSRILSKPTAPERLLEVVSEMLGTKAEHPPVPERFEDRHHQLLKDKLLEQVEALRLSEDRFRLLAENATDMIFRLRLRPTRAWEYVNPAAKTILGYSPREFYEEPELLFKIIHPDCRDELQRYISEGPVSEKPIQLRLIDKEGKGTWMEISGALICDDASDLLALEGIARNVTERKELIEEICRTRDQLEMRVRERTAELERANRALVTLSRCNEALVRAKSEKELLDQVCKILVEAGGYRMAWIGYAEHDEEKRIRPMAQAGYEAGYLDSITITWGESQTGSGPGGTAIKTGKPCVAKNILNDPKFLPWRDEALKRGYASNVSMPLMFDGDNPAGVLAIYADEPDAFDKDEMKLLLNLAEDLSFGIASIRSRAERRRAEEKLRIYTARLAQQNRELEDFAFISSHHVQEPLRKIMTFSDRLRTRFRDKLDPEAEDYIDRMHKSVKVIQALIRDLLMYSRISAETVGFVPVDLRRVVRNVLTDLDRSIEEAGAHVELSNLPTIEADGIQLRKLFSHLIKNAVKFRGESALVIKIYGKTKSPGDREFLEVHVEDNGIGFDEKYLGRIFTPFQRLHGKSRYEGTGMGLAMCRRIVELHNGSITARSVPGEGATFIVSLPVHQERKEESP